jgi:cysteine-rich repeat protein
MTTRALVLVCLTCLAGCGDSPEDAVCGDGVHAPIEQCDDGNTTDGDGCSSACLVEIPPGCGDGVVGGGEQCDGAGETASCDIDCTAAACGDSLRNAAAGEACDDGNTTAGDGCSPSCLLELPSLCGDGDVDEGEQCDDGNTTSGDGCSSTCTTEEVAMCGIGALACDGTAMGSTADADATSIHDLYPCLGDVNASGPEKVFEWVADRDGQVGVWLEALGPLNLIVAEAAADCGLGECLAAGPAGGTFTAVEGTRYLIIVDTAPDQTGMFFLGMSCP